MFELEAAWDWRKRLGVFQETEAFRVFHGPGEGSKELQNFAIDRFQHHYWITEGIRKAFSPPKCLNQDILNSIIAFLCSQGAQSIVQQGPTQSFLSESSPIFGTPPDQKFKIREGCLYFWIQIDKARHCGLFLDQAPLRKWLFSAAKGMRVLNTFAYTGSFSVAAAKSGAGQVWSIDLAHSAIEWAKENWSLNALNDSKARWIVGDVFEWLYKLKKKKERFDCIILDPPSFSQKKGSYFSALKDLKELHILAMEILSQDGILITSLHAGGLLRKKYEQDVIFASQKNQRKWGVLSEIHLPETFPTRFGHQEDRYLKGWILRSLGRSS